MMMGPHLEPCPNCGLVLPYSSGEKHPYLGASAACWTLYGEVLEREYSNPAYMAVHRITVDAYAAQHPGKEESRTVQSINVHLVGLYLTLERKLHPDFARRAIAALTREKDQLHWLEAPTPLGEIRVDDVLKAATPEEHAIRVTEWGGSVWQAWSSCHAEVISLADRAAMAMS